MCHDSGLAPLLPATTRSLRSVSVILTSPPQQAKRARSGSLQLHSAQPAGGETGDQSKIALGNRGWSQHSCPWKVQAKPACMTAEGAQGAALRAARTHRAPHPSHEETCKPRRPLGTSFVRQGGFDRGSFPRASRQPGWMSGPSQRWVSRRFTDPPLQCCDQRERRWRLWVARVFGTRRVSSPSSIRPVTR